MAEKVDFWQIYYREGQEKHIYPFAKPYFNENLTVFFENSVIFDKVLTSEADKVAVCSWALREKRTMIIPPKRELTEEVLKEDFDVMSFTKNAPGHNMLVAMGEWRPKGVEIKDVLLLLWKKMGLKAPNHTTYPIYQNAFCARRDIYLKYVKEFLCPAMILMEYDDELRDMCMQDSGYTRTITNRPVYFESVKANLGLEWIPFHPFILERCFSLWIENKNLKIVYL